MSAGLEQALRAAAPPSSQAAAAERALARAPGRLRVLLNTGSSVQETSMPLSYCPFTPRICNFFSVPSLLSF